jgi:HPt (histidine-containing phosphotransfer) domain-containing protein
MTSTAQPGGLNAVGAAAAADLGAALDQLWARFLPEIRARVDMLDTAAAACEAGTLQVAQHLAAHAAAHKLAGTLGTFNLAQGTELAREFELAFSCEEAPDSVMAERLIAISKEIRRIVESRG